MILYILIFLVVDIISKLVISNIINLGESIKIINNFFYITNVQNTGAAWSIFTGKILGIILISIFIIGGIILYVYKNKPNNKLEHLGYSMIIGGAIGNLVDRIIYGYVIDFLDFYLFKYDYPIFNLADSFIVVGVVLLIIQAWRSKK